MHAYFSVLDFIPLGAFVLDSSYTLLFWNKCMETWTGTPAQELLHQDIRSHFPDLGHPKFTSRLEGLFLGGPPVIFSAQLHRYIIPAPLPGGGMRLQNTLVNAVHTESGYLALFTLQDVTEISQRLEQYISMRNHALREVDERRKAEEEIREREAMYRSIFETIRAVKVIIDPQSGDIVDANTAACYFYGYPYPQFMRMNIQQITSMPLNETFDQMHLAVQEKCNYHESTHRLANGSLRQVEVHSAPIEVRGQTLLYSIIHDVTERNQAEAALRQSEATFRLLFELAGDMILVHEATGRILDANQFCCEKLGYSKDALLQLQILDIAPTAEKELGDRVQLFREDRPVTFETAVHCRSGERIPVEVQARGITINSQPAVISIGRDISERKKMESLREEVERITRHDLKNPLGAVLGLPDILLQTASLDEEQKSLLKVIQNAGYTMLHMINQSLDLYKIETGAYNVTPSQVNILRLLERILGEGRELLQSKKLLAEVSVQETNDTGVFVLGEEMLCYSMLSNLISNALEASPEGQAIHINVSATADTVTVSIQNKGTVPEAIRETFLNKYVTSGKPHGTGLGTYSARLMAEVQQGDITFDTSPENGTTVTICLPRAKPQHSSDHA